MSKLELTGQKFGRLTVVSEVAERRHRMILWECLCDCGKTSTVCGSRLKSGHTQSCGCLNHERSTTHGKRNTIEYVIWSNMIQRCTNKKASNYKHYGGRGISMCQSWLLDVRNFIKDIGKCPEGLTIERKDNNKGYFKANCCWATRIEQARNQRIRKDNSTKISGVTKSRTKGKFIVHITVNKKQIYTGTFSTLTAAAIARKNAEKTYWRKEYD